MHEKNCEERKVKLKELTVRVKVRVRSGALVLPRNVGKKGKLLYNPGVL